MGDKIRASTMGLKLSKFVGKSVNACTEYKRVTKSIILRFSFVIILCVELIKAGAGRGWVGLI